MTCGMCGGTNPFCKYCGGTGMSVEEQEAKKATDAKTAKKDKK